MCNFESISYLVSGLLYLALSIVFLSMNGTYSKEYVRLKRMFALCALMAMFVDAIRLGVVTWGYDCGLCDRFMVPVAYICQAYLLTGSILYLMRSSKASFGSMAALSVPLLLVVILYVGCFGEFCSTNGFSMASYFFYTKMELTKLFSIALYVVMLVELPICLYWLFTELHAFSRSGIQGTGIADVRSLSMSVFLFCVYFVFAIADLVIPSAEYAILFDWLSLMAFVSVGLAILRLRTDFVVRTIR